MKSNSIYLLVAAEITALMMGGFFALFIYTIVHYPGEESLIIYATAMTISGLANAYLLAKINRYVLEHHVFE